MKKLEKILSIVLVVFVEFSLSCASSKGDESDKSAGYFSVVASTNDTVSEAICEFGGIQVDTGIDENGNGVLDSDEVDNTQYVCNRATGDTFFHPSFPDGANGVTKNIELNNSDYTVPSAKSLYIHTAYADASRLLRINSKDTWPVTSSGVSFESPLVIAGGNVISCPGYVYLRAL